MTDVFIRSTSKKTPLRQAMEHVSFERWCLEPEVQVRTLYDCDVRKARTIAEETSESDPYIFTDDDVLIVGKDWVRRGVEALLSMPEYGIVSSLSLVEGENLAKGSGTIYPMHAVGQPMFVRKGICGDLPEDFNFTYECQILQKLCEDKGRKMGLVNGLRHNHLGHGFSGSPCHFWGY